MHTERERHRPSVPSPAVDGLRRTPPSAGATRPEVELLRWPADADRREELRRAGRPRLLLLLADVPPPTDTDDHEDWAWLPVDERDLFARLRRLAAVSPPPGELDLAALAVDEDGVLRGAARLVPLPPVEAALLGVLLDPPVRIRSRQELSAAAWGRADRRRRSLDSRVLTLRRRIAPVGLAVHVVRGRGFLLGAMTSPEAAR